MNENTNDAPASPSDGVASIFIYENGDPIEIWVLPNLRHRKNVVDDIKAYGGAITSVLEEAHYAIVPQHPKQDDLQQIQATQTTALSHSWVTDSVEQNEVQPWKNYVVWERDGKYHRTEDGSISLIPDASPPMISSSPPDKISKDSDEKYFLWAAEGLWKIDSSTTWADIHRWCAAHTENRPESFWSALNQKGTTLRSKSNAIWRGLVSHLNSPPSGSVPYDTENNIKEANHIKEESSPAPCVVGESPLNASVNGKAKRYTDEEYLSIIEHLATCQAPSRALLIAALHEKHPQRTVAALTQHVSTKEFFFRDQVSRFLAGKPFQLVNTQAAARPASMVSSPFLEWGPTVAAGVTEAGGRTGSRDSDAPTPTTSEYADDPDEQVKSVSSLTAGGRRHPKRITQEERNAMTQHIFNTSGMPATSRWQLFHKEYPHRSAASWREYVRNHPSVEPDDNYQEPESSEHGLGAIAHATTSGNALKWSDRIPYTIQDDQEIIRHIARQPSPLPDNFWGEFATTHPGHSAHAWKMKYSRNKAQYRNAAEQLDQGSEPRPQSSSSLKRPRSHDTMRPPAPKHAKIEKPGRVPTSSRATPTPIDSGTSVRTPESPLYSRRRASTSSHAPSSVNDSQRSISDTTSFTRAASGSSTVVAAPPAGEGGGGFTREDRSAAIQWVACRDPPQGPAENLRSWAEFAETHPAHDAEGWLELYYSDLSFFKSIERRV